MLIEPIPLKGTDNNSFLLGNGTVLTMDDVVPVAEAVLVQDGLIVAVGGDEEISDLAPPGTEVIDLQGKTLLPGFIDSHAHWIGDRDLAGHSTPEDAIQAALENGWTSISELFVNQGRLDELLSLDEAGHLRLRVNAYLPLNWQHERYGDWYQDYVPGHEYSPRLRIGGVKIFVDGNWGRDVYFSQEDLDGLVMEAHQAGFQIATHVFGGASNVDLILNAYEDALQGESNDVHRHRVEHLTMVSDDQLDRMLSLGIIASIQLTFFNSDWIEDLEAVLDPEDLPLVGRWRDLLGVGVPSIGSTDSPWGYGSVGPSMKAVYQIVTRIGEQGLPPPQWMLDQRITVEQALRLITIDAAYGTFQEDVKGSITPGKYADLVVLSDNPLEATHEELLDIQVLMTMVGGKIEFSSLPRLDVVVNEVELNPPGDDTGPTAEEWVELYNPTDQAKDLGGWTLDYAGGTATLPEGWVIPAGGHRSVGGEVPWEWLANDDETIILRDGEGVEVDRTPILSDLDDDDHTWQRYPDGQDTDSAEDWVFEEATPEYENIPEFPHLGTLTLLIASMAVLFVLVRGKAMTRKREAEPSPA